MIYVFLIPLIAEYFGNKFFYFDLASHFHLQLLVIASLLIFWYFFKKIWLELALSLLAAGFLVYSIMDTSFAGIYNKNDAVKNPGLFYMDTEFSNEDTDKSIENYIKQVQPKQIALTEVNAKLFEKIKASQNFKYNYYYPDDIYSFAFFTNEPVIEQKTYLSAEYPIGFFRTKERSYYIIHPLYPITTERYEAQKKLFSELVTEVSGKGDFIILGEFNTAPRSRVFQSYFSPFQYQSFYSWGKTMVASLRIDHFVSSKKLEILPGTKQSSNYSPFLINF